MSFDDGWKYKGRKRKRLHGDRRRLDRLKQTAAAPCMATNPTGPGLCKQRQCRVERQRASPLCLSTYNKHKMKRERHTHTQNKQTKKKTIINIWNNKTHAEQTGERPEKFRRRRRSPRNSANTSTYILTDQEEGRKESNIYGISSCVSKK
jgi:hypothetical protein